ncbi:unnamed protein product [Nyctereutes procyonoides]|uniref:(raccoon dog) hypothetical protein n=1 Tax=Nyctereutes procyonoides TaxID=34880 RepID=A0A811ZLC3_NYCPR|nr:unnamed protein product [Nyctereutes procyonoides]
MDGLPVVLVASERRPTFSWRRDRLVYLENKANPISCGAVLETAKQDEDGSRRVLCEDLSDNPESCLMLFSEPKHLPAEHLLNAGLDKEEWSGLRGGLDSFFSPTFHSMLNLYPNWCLFQGCLDQRIPGSEFQGHHQASSLTPPSHPHSSQSDHPTTEEVSCELFIKNLLQAKLYRKHFLLGTWEPQ